MSQPTEPKRRLLDLFCGAGGAAMGYHRAGFTEIVGVDITPQPHYPFDFVQADALNAPLNIQEFDLIHASPPYQHYTQMLNHGLTPRSNHADLIGPVRTMLKETRKPYVIENVMGAPLAMWSIMLCGEMFGLRVTRHRLFESSIPVLAAPHPHHRGTHIRKQNDGGYYYRVYGHETGKASWGAAMGIDWMRSPELAQAIPPAYTEWIGQQLIRQMEDSAYCRQVYLENERVW